MRLRPSYMSGCIDFVVYTNRTRDYFEGWWLAIGFIVGLIIGLVIAFLLLKLCIAGILKKKVSSLPKAVITQCPMF